MREALSKWESKTKRLLEGQSEESKQVCVCVWHEAKLERKAKETNFWRTKKNRNQTEIWGYRKRCGKMMNDEQLHEVMAFFLYFQYHI